MTPRLRALLALACFFLAVSFLLVAYERLLFPNGLVPADTAVVVLANGLIGLALWALGLRVARAPQA